MKKVRFLTFFIKKLKNELKMALFKIDTFELGTGIVNQTKNRS